MVNISRDRNGKTRVAKGDKTGLGGQYAPDPQKLAAAKHNMAGLHDTYGVSVPGGGVPNVDSVAGFSRRELFEAGMTGQELIEFESRPPAGAKQNYVWSDVVVQNAEKTGYTKSYYPGFVVAEALADTTSKLQRAKYDNLPSDPPSRLALLQQDGDKYKALADIVSDNKEGVFSSATVALAEKVSRKINYSSDRVFAPVSKNNAGEWDVDVDASQLLYLVSGDVKNLPQHAASMREKTISQVSSTADKYNVYETSGQGSLQNVNSFDRLRNENSRKPSPGLVQARIQKRLTELELQNFDAKKPNIIVGLFTSGRRKKQRASIVNNLSHAEQNLRFAENQ